MGKDETKKSKIDFSRFNKKITIKYEKQIKLLVVMLILQYWMLYLYDLLCYVPDRFWNWVVDVVIHIVITIPPLLVYLKTGLHKEVIDFKNKKQYIFGVICSLIFFGACFVVFGIDTKTNSYVILNSGLLWLFIYYFFVVAISEEFFYRVYLQGELAVILGKYKWIAPIISGFMFGWLHVINVGYESAVMNIIVGIILGYAKLYLKNCTFISCVMAHGLYDFIITVTGW